MVKDCWFQSDFQSYTGFHLFKKFQMLKDRIKIWCKNAYGKFDVARDPLARVVEGQDMEEEVRALLQHEFITIFEAISNLWTLNRMEKVAWRQKSIVL